MESSYASPSARFINTSLVETQIKSDLVKLADLTNSFKDIVRHNAQDFWGNVRLHVKEESEFKRVEKSNNLNLEHTMWFETSNFFGISKKLLFYVSITLQGFITEGKKNEIKVPYHSASIRLGKYEQPIKQGQDTISASVESLKQNISRKFKISESQVRVIYQR